jgi:hypothetical protein
MTQDTIEGRILDAIEVSCISAKIGGVLCRAGFACRRKREELGGRIYTYYGGAP